VTSADRLRSARSRSCTYPICSRSSSAPTRSARDPAGDLPDLLDPALTLPLKALSLAINLGLSLGLPSLPALLYALSEPCPALHSKCTQRPRKKCTHLTRPERGVILLMPKLLELSVRFSLYFQPLRGWILIVKMQFINYSQGKVKNYF
jgi:hypothetical protein